MKRKLVKQVETEIQDKLQDQRTLIIEVSNVGLKIMKDAERKLKGEILEGNITYGSALALKMALDFNMRSIMQIQEIDTRMRRLISENNDIMEEASNAFPLDPERVVTD